MTDRTPSASRPTSDAVTASTDIVAPPDRVFNIVLDPTGYPHWLRGAKRIRSVDDEWPVPGSAFHHVVGVGPLALTPALRLRNVDSLRLLKEFIEAHVRNRM